MKTLSKKLISLMLVAIMLVAAIPFNAFADELEGAEEGVAEPQSMTLAALIKVVCNGEEVATGTYSAFPVDEYASMEEAQQIEITKKALSAVGSKNVNTKYYDTKDVIGTYDSSTGTFTIEVTLKAHDCVVVCAGTYDENGHEVKCTVIGCGATATEPHNDKEIVSTVAAKKATCTTYGVSKKITYKCGYVVGGEVLEDEGYAPHDYDSKGVCKNCSETEPGEEFNVYITCKGMNLATDGVVELSESELKTFGSNPTSKTNAAYVLAKTVGDDLYGYYSRNTTYITKMEIAKGEINTIFVTVSKDASENVGSSNDSKPLEITFIDGTTNEVILTKTMNIGDKYFNNIPSSLSNRNVTSLKIYRGDVLDRTVKSSEKNSASAKVQDGDTKVVVVWNAKRVCIEFYNTSNTLYETRYFYAGQILTDLPTINDVEQDWYVNGELLVEGETIYDWNATTVKAYLATQDVYMIVYDKNLNLIQNEPIQVTGLVQTSGVISKTDILAKVRTATKKSTLKTSGFYLFDEEGIEYYKNNDKSTKKAESELYVGQESERVGTQFIYVVTSSASSTADSSNPKTGDSAMIGTAAAVLFLSVAGLGSAAYIMKKKEQQF